MASLPSAPTEEGTAFFLEPAVVREDRGEEEREMREYYMYSVHVIAVNLLT